MCAGAQNGYDPLQKDEVVCISTKYPIFKWKKMTNQLTTGSAEQGV